jgi:transglutaminase-like putative cysteine protease
MILEVQHETFLNYSSPVTESLGEIRMEPISDEHQSCRSFFLSLNPSAESVAYQDGFGNRVHHFNVIGSCKQLRVTAASIVETHPRAAAISRSQATYPLNLDQMDPSSYDFLNLRGPVRGSAQLTELLQRLQPRPGTPIGQVVHDVADYICTHFEYARDVTLASSPIDDLLLHGKGVCQDFTHLMIALLRSFGVPSRYVSGYIHRPNKDSQSHAWCEVWLPDQGWCGIDPTNNREVDDHFIKVATGRDFTDVSPNKGVYRGQAQEEIFVRVETRELDRLPPLSWQEKLPPFEVPLTPVPNRNRSFSQTILDAYQSQQQQQQ